MKLETIARILPGMPSRPGVTTRFVALLMERQSSSIAMFGGTPSQGLSERGYLVSSPGHPGLERQCRKAFLSYLFHQYFIMFSPGILVCTLDQFIPCLLFGFLNCILAHPKVPYILC
ncbi:hypothetical protein QLX08_009337 [Tetragonisca angustula]|uniref:Uncharacterized protein n=1 Tax=Tetragonisca angustula TaxID=166442 RepID=A0AAW0ZHT9_9HYME